MSSDWPRSNVYRDGQVHVLSEMCGTCIFNPKTRPVPGKRVAEMVRSTQAELGANVVCHATLGSEPQENAVCRGWYDRLSDNDPLFRMARSLDVIVEVEPPAK